MDGDLNAGEGMGGEGIAAPLPSPVLTRPRALKFDPSTRTHTKNANGTYADLHPVDAVVALCIFVASGQVKSASKLGLNWKAIGSPHHIRAKRTAQDMVKLALAEPLKRKDITIMSIEFETRGAYTVMLVVNYVNERLYPRVSQTAERAL